LISLDTNILARFLLRDDEEQYRAAVELFAQSDDYTAPPTVILELVWVLQVSDCTRTDIVKALKVLFGLPNFKPQAFERLLIAVRWYEEGMDFGDAIHMAFSVESDSFVTIDKGLARKVSASGIYPKVVVLKTKSDGS
jgi:predicted nucleic-acid-binding protein